MSGSSIDPAGVYGLVFGSSLIKFGSLEVLADQILEGVAGRRLELIDSRFDFGDGRPLCASVSVIYHPRPERDGQSLGNLVALTAKGEQAATLADAVTAAVERRKQLRAKRA